MSEVAALGYIVISAEIPSDWKAYGEGCLGLTAAALPAADGGREAVYFRFDERSWRLAVEQGADGGLVALGFEVADREGFERLVTRLQAAGIEAKHAPIVATQRQVEGLVQLTDPSGVPLELYYGPRNDKANFVSPWAARFITGDQGFGHAVVTANNADETYAFYVELLGFRLSDTIAFGPFSLYFTSPNGRHHSLAFGAFPGTPGGKLQHIMFEVDDLDIVGRALDQCLDAGIVERSLGKHTNDHMVSFYSRSPSGLMVEYGYGGRVVDDASFQYVRYDAASYWGHRPPAAT